MFKVIKPDHQAGAELGLKGGDRFLPPVLAPQSHLPEIPGRQDNWLPCLEPRSPCLAQSSAASERSPAPFTPQEADMPETVPKGTPRSPCLAGQGLSPQSLQPPIQAKAADPQTAASPTRHLPPRSASLTQLSARRSRKQKHQEWPHRGASASWDWGHRTPPVAPTADTGGLHTAGFLARQT